MLAARGLPTLYQIIWIVVAMVGARSAAMAFNRLADARWDAANPRTSNQRDSPPGLLSTGFVDRVSLWCRQWLLAGAAWMLNPLCFKLSPLALGVVCFYSYTKRFTSWSHLVLGFSLGIAPAAAWIAVRGSLDPAILLLDGRGDAVDWPASTSSTPARTWSSTAAVGPPIPRHVRRIARRSRLSIGDACGDDAAAGRVGRARCISADRHWPGLALVAGLLIYEHSLVKPGDLSRVNPAFFNVNPYISVLFFVSWSAAVFNMTLADMFLEAPKLHSLILEKLQSRQKLTGDDALTIYRSHDLHAIAQLAGLVREARHGRRAWARLDLGEAPVSRASQKQRIAELLALAAPAVEYEPPLEPGLSGYTYLKHVAVARLLLDQVDHIVVRHCLQVENVCQLALRFGADTLVGPNVAELERQIQASGLKP